MNRKIKVLLHGEASYAASGFGKFTMNILKRLYDTGKYELAELSNFGHYSQVNRDLIPWRFYSVLPDPGEETEYNNNWENKFGKYRFEEVVLDFKPDYVLNLMDFWMVTSAFNSPLRDFYKLGYISCVDSSPIKQDWLAMIEEADDVFSYTQWGLDVIAQQSSKANIRSETSPGADLNFFKPHPNKKELRESYGLDPDLFIVGMVARNQKRKLYPDLFAGFRKFLDKYGGSHKEITDKCRLLIHSSFPDMGFDFIRLIHEYRLANRLLCTYLCRNCKKTSILYFRDAKTVCPHCKQVAAVFPRVDVGVSEAELANIMNTMDVYAQVCTNEGFAMPLTEASSCSLVLMATDYSAPSDIVRRLGGYPLPIHQLFREPETQADKAVPNNDAFADVLFEYISLSPEEKQAKGFQSRVSTIKNYNYNLVAKRLMEQIDKVDLDPDRWNKPAQIFEPVTQIPQFKSFYDMTTWCITHILGKPELINSAFHKRITTDVCLGFKTVAGGSNLFINENSLLGMNTQPTDFPWNQLVNELIEMRKNMNYWELRRTGQIQVPTKNYILQAGGR